MEFNNILFDKDNQTRLIELNRPKGCSVFKGEKGGINKIGVFGAETMKILGTALIFCLNDR